MALANVVTPSARPSAAARNAVSTSLASKMSRYWSFTPKTFAASSSSLITSALVGAGRRPEDGDAGELWDDLSQNLQSFAA